MSSHITKHGTKGGGREILIEFDDNELLPTLYGEFDRNLARIEQELGVSLSSRGNRVEITGAPSEAAIARDALAALHERLAKGLAVEIGEVDAAIRLARNASTKGPNGFDRYSSSNEILLQCPSSRFHWFVWLQLLLEKPQRFLHPCHLGLSCSTPWQ